MVRVHRELLGYQKLPPALVTGDIWMQRYEDINAFERYLSRKGTRILKFFLHVSRKEQKKRFLRRLDDPAKNWKFSAADVEERQHWDAYMEAYEAGIRATATEHAPWHVVPADHKWFTRLAVVSAVVAALEELDLAYPEVSPDEREKFEAARSKLAAE